MQYIVIINGKNYKDKTTFVDEKLAKNYYSLCKTKLLKSETIKFIIKK